MGDLRKHIYKKFYNEINASEEVIDKLSKTQIPGVLESGTWEMIKSGKLKISDIPKGFKAQLLMDSGKVVTAFPFNHKGSFRMIPEPDPILIYFHTAYVYYTQIETKRSLVIESTAVEVITADCDNTDYCRTNSVKYRLHPG